MLILDTNIVIGYLHGEPSITKVIDAHGEHMETFMLPTVVVVELLSYELLTDEDRKAIGRFLDRARISDLSIMVALEAADLRRRYKLTTVDAVVAATAQYHRAPLVSRDRAFQKIPDLELTIP